MNITTQQRKFTDFLSEISESSEYSYKFLRHDLANIYHGTSPIYEDSLLNVEGDNWILLIHSTDLLIYGVNWSDAQLQEILAVFDLTQYKNYLLRGDADLINALINLYAIEGVEVELERRFYRTEETNDFPIDNKSISLAERSDLRQLASMMQTYFHEEYQGANDKTIEDSMQRVIKCVKEKCMYVLKNEKGFLVSFCTIIDPDVGILFTLPDYRNLGNGKTLLSYCSQMLLRKNKEVYLMTMASKTSSNNTSRAVGYKPYFEFAWVRINIKA